MAKGYCDQKTFSDKTPCKELSADLVLVVLAAMEAYRLKTQHNGLPDYPDFDMRALQSLLADACGMGNRNIWTGKIQAEGLLDYKGDAKQQYKTLVERIESEAKKNGEDTE